MMSLAIYSQQYYNMIRASKAPMHIENLTLLYHFNLRYGIL